MVDLAKRLTAFIWTLPLLLLAPSWAVSSPLAQKYLAQQALGDILDRSAPIAGKLEQYTIPLDQPFLIQGLTWDASKRPRPAIGWQGSPTTRSWCT